MASYLSSFVQDVSDGINFFGDVVESAVQEIMDDVDDWTRSAPPAEGEERTHDTAGENNVVAGRSVGSSDAISASAECRCQPQEQTIDVSAPVIPQHSTNAVEGRGELCEKVPAEVVPVPVERIKKKKKKQPPPPGAPAVTNSQHCTSVRDGTEAGGTAVATQPHRETAEVSTLTHQDTAEAATLTSPDVAEAATLSHRDAANQAQEQPCCSSPAPSIPRLPQVKERPPPSLVDRGSPPSVPAADATALDVDDSDWCVLDTPVTSTVCGPSSSSRNRGRLTEEEESKGEFTGICTEEFRPPANRNSNKSPFLLV